MKICKKCNKYPVFVMDGEELSFCGVCLFNGIKDKFIDPYLAGSLTMRETDGGDVSQFFSPDKPMACGHEEKYIVYSERRNYCGICGQDAHPIREPFNPPRRGLR